MTTMTEILKNVTEKTPNQPFTEVAQNLKVPKAASLAFLKVPSYFPGVFKVSFIISVIQPLWYKILDLRSMLV